jgi:hypothetical protein
MVNIRRIREAISRAGSAEETMLPRRRMAFSHVIYTSGFFFLTIAFALTTIVALTLRFAGEPQVLKVTVGPPDGDNAKLIGAIARHLERDGGRIRFVVNTVDDLAQSAKALEQGRADLAVIRSDIAIPQNGTCRRDRRSPGYLLEHRGFLPRRLDLADCPGCAYSHVGLIICALNLARRRSAPSRKGRRSPFRPPASDVATE